LAPSRARFRNYLERQIAPMTEPKKSFDELKSQGRSGMVSEFLYFLGQNKKWWLLPILIVIGLVGILVLLAGTGAAPFIYTMF
jgi:hypothetical protein